MTNNLRKKIEKYTSVTDEMWQFIEETTEVMYIKKKEVLIKYSELNRNVYFIDSGSFEMSLISGNGDSKTVWFFLDEIFRMVSAMDSLFLDEPTKYEITALEDSKVTKFSYSTLKIWQERYPKINEFCKNDLLNDIMQSNEIRNHMVSHTPSEFIEYLKNKYPFLLERIPDKNIAYFMGITPEWFSKIK